MNTQYRIRFLSLKFGVFLYLVLYIGKGCSLVSNIDFRTNPIGGGLYLLCLLYMFVSSRKRPLNKKRCLKIILIFLVWSGLHIMTDSQSAPYFYYVSFAYLIGGVLIAKTYREEIPCYYVKAMTFYSLVSLFFWSFQMIGGTTILDSLPFLLDNSSGNGDYSILIYTIATEDGKDMYRGLLRNCGCAWEPGLFSTMISIAILFAFMQNSVKSSNRYHTNLLILFVALLTTYSTTGFVTILLLCGIYLFVSAKWTISRKVVVGALFMTFAYGVYSLPFVSEKIEITMDRDNFSSEKGTYVYHEGIDEKYTVDRFEGLLLDGLNIMDAPWIGYGCYTAESYVEKYISSAILTSNGIAKPIAQFGIPLGLLLFVLLYIGCKELSMCYNYPYHYLLFFAILLSSVSYDLFANPIIRAIQFFVLACPLSQQSIRKL